MWLTKEADIDYSYFAAHSIFGIIAVADNSSGRITLLEEDLEISQHIPSSKTDIAIDRLSWHPSKLFLVICWSNGSLGLWSADGSSAIREGNSHNSPITCLRWNPNGTRLITGDSEGGVVVWKVDIRGKLSIMYQYRLHGVVEHIVFKISPSTSRVKDSNRDNPPFFIADNRSTIFFADDAGHCSECISLSSTIKSIHFHETRDLLVILSDDLFLSHYLLSIDGKLVLDTAWMQMKLGGSISLTKPEISALWLDADMLVYNVGNAAPKVWDSEHEETVVLDRNDLSGLSYGQMVFSKSNEVLAVATNSGSIILWSRYLNGRSYTWEPLQKIDIAGSISSMEWGLGDNVLCIKKNIGFQILSEQVVLIGASGNSLFASIIGDKKLQIEGSSGKIQIIEMESKVKSFMVAKNSICSWNGKAVDYYFIDGEGTAKFQSSLPCPSGCYSIDENFIFCSNQDQVTAVNTQSGVVSKLNIPPSDGYALSSCCSNNIFHIFTSEKVLKSFDTKKDFKTSSQRVDLDLQASYNVAIKPNADSTLIAFQVSNESNTISILNVNTSKFFIHECGSKIKSFFWDLLDPRILVAHIQSANSKEEGNSSPNKQGQNQIISFFITDANIIFKDIQEVPLNAEMLVSVQVPYHYFYKKLEFKAEVSERFMRSTIKEYSGIDVQDDALIRIVTEFSFNLASGQLDNAAKVIKLIKNEAVWENMARVCIKMKRTKLAQLCLGKLKNAKALRTISASKVKDQNDLAAQISLHLGLYEDAKENWMETNNFSQLSSFYQASRDWGAALEVSAVRDRPALPSIYFRFAQYLDSTGDQAGAIAAYEKSNASKAQIPRLILNNANDLQNYIDSSNDKETMKWWAKNAESHGDIETATKYYNEIKDPLSSARIFCRSGLMSQAIEVADLNPTNLSIAYSIAKQFEKEQSWGNAISFYSRAKCYGSAIDIAKKHGFGKELLQLAIQSSNSRKIDVAKHFERLNDIDKAVTLYAKGNWFKKALSLCYKSKKLDLLELIASQLDPNIDGTILHSASIFLAEHGSHEMALKILLVVERTSEALDVCESKDIIITEDLFNSFSFPSSLPDNDIKSINIRLGNLCLSQGSYSLACKAFTSGGDRLKAIGALLKAGDKEKIITFANVSKHIEIYTIAANFLQSLPWVNDTFTIKTIIQFYTKAKAYGALARFYESCAQVEIDEFKNYQKALSALAESEHALEKDLSGVELDVIKHKQECVSIFLEALQHAASGNLEKCESFCAILLNQDAIDGIVRIGDILGLLIETSFKAGQIEKAKQLFQKLKARLINLNVEYYVEKDICAQLA